MDYRATRRRVLASIGATAAVAGCLGDDSVGDDDGGSSPADGSDSNGNGTDDTSDMEYDWPAVDMGESITTFDEDTPLEALTGQFEGVPDEARIGSQALAVEDSGDDASVALFFPDGLDLDGWDVSMAVKAESINRIAIEFHAPEFGDHLTSFRRLPDDHDDWLRVDFGYDEKQGDPDLTNVTELRIFGFSADDGPTRFLVDDMRRTEAVTKGKVILACYDGHLSHLDVAAPRLADRDMPGTVAVDPRQIGRSNRMDAHDLRDLRDRGWDICPAPDSGDGLSGLPEQEQRSMIESAQAGMQDSGLEDGSRHFFAPNWREYDPTTHEIVRDQFETGFVFGSSTSGMPPTAPDLLPMSWGPALHGGIRRQINIADQYQLLVVLRIPRLVVDEDEVNEGSEMWVGAFEDLLDHIEQRGLDVITPSELVDESFESNGGDDESLERPDGVIISAGRQHAISGSGSEVTNEFEIDDGILISSFSVDDSRSFSTELVDVVGGRSNRRFTQTDGHRSGQSILSVDAGSYRIDVEASGSWDLELNQPQVHSDDLEDLPHSVSGTGSGVVGPMWIPESGSLEITHDGSHDFLVDMHAAKGGWERIVDDAGTFDSNRSYGVTGTVWVNVEADGSWSIDIG